MSAIQKLPFGLMLTSSQLGKISIGADQQLSIFLETLQGLLRVENDKEYEE